MLFLKKPSRLFNYSVFLFLCIVLGLLACGKPQRAPEFFDLEQVASRLAYKSYNGVDDTFERIHVERLMYDHSGRGILVHIDDVDRIDFNHPQLGWRFLHSDYDSTGHVGHSGHATSMALILAGSRDSTGHTGIAPGVKTISTGRAYFPLITGRAGVQPVIRTSSVLGNNLGTCGYTGAYPGWLEPTVSPPPHIYVIIAGNNGPSVETDAANRLDAWAWPGRPLPLSASDFYYPSEGNIIVTVAVDSSNHITTSSSRCGKTRRFCIAVPSPGTTSETAPIVTGVLALLMEAVPGKTLRQYVDAVLRTATPLSNPDQTGVGLLNAQAAWDYLRALP